MVALGAYERTESRGYNKWQFKLSALKNTEHGAVCSWRAAGAYADTEKDARDQLLAKIKAEKEQAS